MITRFLSKFIWWFRILPRPEFVVRGCLDMPGPHELRKGEVVVVGLKDQPKWATFLCPCGCGVPLLLSLNPRRRPRWSVAADWLGRPTVDPSIRRTDGCHSHFWMRRGYVDWCRDSGAASRRPNHRT